MIRIIVMGFALLTLIGCASNKPIAKAVDMAPVCDCAPRPPPAFYVFFDWGKANLRPKSVEIIAIAASESHFKNFAILTVSGHTDNTGPKTYNQQLSFYRAETVAKQLEADGIAASKIQIHAFGSDQPMVETPYGVREPQDRYVEIVLQ